MGYRLLLGKMGAIPGGGGGGRGEVIVAEYLPYPFPSLAAL
jgi:hypothetical protein